MREKALNITQARSRRPVDREERLSFAATVLLSLITFYQRYISPAHRSCCRFTPTCSSYAAQAIRSHGALKGTGLGIWRILRCQPLCKGGYDPVPVRNTRKDTL